MKKVLKSKSPLIFYFKKAILKCKKTKLILTFTRKLQISNSNPPINTVLWTCYIYLNKMQIEGIINTSGFVSEAITAYTKYLQQILADNMKFAE